MASRWTEKERVALEEVRRRLKDEIQARPQYPDVVGDRRIIRFLRAKQNDVNEASKMFSGFLKWRDENNVDDIRNQILYGGLDTPFKFPNGKKIIDLAPQIIISAKAKDFKGQPLVLEQYSFSPTEMFSRVTINDYLLFLVYALEYRALVMEQMSHEEEGKYLESHPSAADRADGYGVVLLNFCIRDLNGVGLSHLTGKGKQIIEAAINIGLPNYPEYLGKCHMVNVPWLFTSMWFFIKGLLDDFILAKINLTGSKFLDTLLKDMPPESIPKALGGRFELYNESYAFDVTDSGPFHVAGGVSSGVSGSVVGVSGASNGASGGVYGNSSASGSASGDSLDGIHMISVDSVDIGSSADHNDAHRNALSLSLSASIDETHHDHIVHATPVHSHATPIRTTPVSTLHTTPVHTTPAHTPAAYTTPSHTHDEHTDRLVSSTNTRGKMKHASSTSSVNTSSTASDTCDSDGAVHKSVAELIAHVTHCPLTHQALHSTPQRTPLNTPYNTPNHSNTAHVHWDTPNTTNNTHNTHTTHNTSNVHSPNSHSAHTVITTTPITTHDTKTRGASAPRSTSSTTHGSGSSGSSGHSIMSLLHRVGSKSERTLHTNNMSNINNNRNACTQSLTRGTGFTTSAAATTFQAMLQQEHHLCSVDSGNCHTPSPSSKRRRAACLVTKPCERVSGVVSECATSPLYIVLTLLLLSGVCFMNPKFAYQYLMAPFLFALFFIYVI